MHELREDPDYRVNDTSDHGHGQIDERAYAVLNLPHDGVSKKQWRLLK